MFLKNPRYLAAVVLLMLAISCKHEIPLQPPQPQHIITSTSCSPDTVYFQQRVLPVFISHCTQSGCHNADSHKEGIVLDSYTSIMRTGKIRPFQPNNSDIYKKIMESNFNDRMPPPPSSPLSQEEKNIIYTWIAQGALNNACSNSCDSAVFSFAGAVRPLITNNCQGCHSGTAPQGGIDLTTYTNIKLRVDDGKLWGSINHLPGFSAMPKNGTMLSPCEIGQVKRWIAAGAPNN